MKLLLLPSLLITVFCLGQKMSKESIKHSYFQTPKYYLSKNKQVKKEVVLTYLEKNKSIVETVDEINKTNNEKAQQKLDDYENEKTSKKVVDQLLFGKKKPSGKGSHLELPFTQKEWARGEILTNSCKTNGLIESSSAEARVVISVLEFRATDKVSDNHSKSGSSYSLNVEGTAGLELKCYNENNELVFSRTTVYEYNRTGKSYTSSSARDKAYSKDVKSLKFEVEKACMKKDLKVMQGIITDNIDYNTIEKKTVIYVVNDKKGVYTEINKCLEDFNKGLQYFSMEETYSRGKNLIEKVIPVYEKELEGYEPNNKKARINKGVAFSLYLNLCNAYIYTNQYDKAKECLIQCKIIDSKKSTKEIKKIKLFLEDHKSRFEAIK